MVTTLDACRRVNGESTLHKDCRQYEELEIDGPKVCDGEERVVPQILHSIGRTADVPYLVRANAEANPHYRLNYLGDANGAEYVREACGDDVSKAYKCFIAPAYRADVFRFCAIWAEGGLYLDSDIISLHPLDRLYLPCRNATIGHDYPQRGSEGGKQMKILAGASRAPLFRCALDTIVNNVRHRSVPENSLMLTGPAMLHRCYVQLHAGVGITYMDTRNSEWPFSGMRTQHELLAFEAPLDRRHFEGGGNSDASSMDYAELFHKRKIYTSDCALR